MAVEARPRTVADHSQGPEIEWAFDGTRLKEAKALEALGVAVIQFDEPVYSRRPERALEIGIPALNRAAAGLKTAKPAAHVCYGYPHQGIARERRESYPDIVDGLEKSDIQLISLEFEVSGIDPKVLRRCPSKTVMFGGKPGNQAKR
ncbi:MAG: hypothetical protein RIB59_10545 [Rhodospirillales bacterium]